MNDNQNDKNKQENSNESFSKSSNQKSNKQDSSKDVTNNTNNHSSEKDNKDNQKQSDENQIEQVYATNKRTEDVLTNDSSYSLDLDNSNKIPKDNSNINNQSNNENNSNGNVANNPVNTPNSNEQKGINSLEEYLQKLYKASHVADVHPNLLDIINTINPIDYYNLTNQQIADMVTDQLPDNDNLTITEKSGSSNSNQTLQTDTSTRNRTGVNSNIKPTSPTGGGQSNTPQPAQQSANNQGGTNQASPTNANPYNQQGGSGQNNNNGQQDNTSQVNANPYNQQGGSGQNNNNGQQNNASQSNANPYNQQGGSDQNNNNGQQNNASQPNANPYNQQGGSGQNNSNGQQNNASRPNANPYNQQGGSGQNNSNGQQNNASQPNANPYNQQGGSGQNNSNGQQDNTSQVNANPYNQQGGSGQNNSNGQQDNTSQVNANPYNQQGGSGQNNSNGQQDNTSQANANPYNQQGNSVQNSDNSYSQDNGTNQSSSNNQDISKHTGTNSNIKPSITLDNSNPINQSLQNQDQGNQTSGQNQGNQDQGNQPINQNQSNQDQGNQTSSQNQGNQDQGNQPVNQKQSNQGQGNQQTGQNQGKQGQENQQNGQNQSNQGQGNQPVDQNQSNQGQGNQQNSQNQGQGNQQNSQNQGNQNGQNPGDLNQGIQSNTNRMTPIPPRICDARDYMNAHVGLGVSFDITLREMYIFSTEINVYITNGLADSALVVQIFEDLIAINDNEPPTTNVFPLIRNRLVHNSVELFDTMDSLVEKLLSGQMVIMVHGYTEAFVVDVRSYPTRSPMEPETEKVIRGSRDGFVENIIINTALTRRRIRDERLRFEIMSVGERSKTDVSIAYIEGIANSTTVNEIRDSLKSIHVDGIPMTDKTIEEYMLGQRIDPYPLVRYTERPDVAAEHLLEGHILIYVDTSPSVMITPTTFFHHLQHAEEYRQSPAVGTYERWMRFIGVWASLFIQPIWLLFITAPYLIPENLSFIGGTDPIPIPTIVQIFIAEFGISLLRMASIHTPSALSSAMSLVAAILVGQLAIDAGLFVEEVIIYVAIATIGTYATPSYELSIANKITHYIFLLATAFFGPEGFVISITFFFVWLAGKRVFHAPYLWPFIPFYPKALFSILIRHRVPTKKLRPAITFSYDRVRESNDKENNS